jgi:hypothetical protein
LLRVYYLWGATLDTGTIIAAAIGAGSLISTQIATMVQLQHHKKRTEAFETSQSEAVRTNARQLTALQSELTQAFNLQTRWDPVRFAIYAEVLNRADNVWPVAIHLASLAKHSEIIGQEKEEGRMDPRTYQKSSADLSDQRRPLEEKWESGNEALESARGRSDMIASPPVRDSVTKLVHSIQTMRGARALMGQNYEYEHPFYTARDEFRDAVRFELGSDHYAAEQTEPS